MKTKLFAQIAIAVAVTAAAPAFADQALATAKNCMACHAVDKKLVAQAIKDLGVNPVSGVQCLCLPTRR